jgi:hypothetical protein
MQEIFSDKLYWIIGVSSFQEVSGNRVIGNKVAQGRVSRVRSAFLMNPINFKRISVFVTHHVVRIKKSIYSFDTRSKYSLCSL